MRLAHRLATIKAQPYLQECTKFKKKHSKVLKGLTKRRVPAPVVNAQDSMERAAKARIACATEKYVTTTRQIQQHVQRVNTR